MHLTQPIGTALTAGRRARSAARFLVNTRAFAVCLGAALFSTTHGAAGQEPVASDTRAKVLDQARRALVRVELYLKSIPDEDGPGGMGETTSSQALDQQQKQVIRFKKPIQMMGAIVSPREVFVPDTGVNPQRIDHWEITDSEGSKTMAVTSALLRDAPTLVLTPTDVQFAWKPVAFSDAEVKATGTVTLVTPDWAPLDLRWLLQVSSVPPMSGWDAGGGSINETFWVVGSLATGSVPTDPTTVGESPAAAVSLIFDSAGQLVGVGLGDRISAQSSNPPWRAADLKRAARISITDLDRIREELEEKVSRSLFPVRIEFRRPKGGFQSLPETELLGWAVGDRLLIAPWELYRQIAARVAKIVIQVGGNDVEAEFVGQVQDFSAIVLRLPDSAEPFPNHADLSSAGRLELYRPNLAVTVARKYGANDLRILSTRSLGLEYGYRNRPSPRFTPAPFIGAVVFDLTGNPIGLFARARRPLEEIELIQTITRQGTASSVSSVEFFPISQLAEVARKPAEAIDRRVVLREEKDQDRRAWLGVEGSALNKDLAESLNCRKESKDGSIGIMVNQIYPGSPAERIGLHTGDVLLSLSIPERDSPVWLATPRGGRGQGDGAQFGGDGQGGGRAPWPSQNNFLTGVLSIIGEGTELQLTYWRDGKLQNTSFAVEQSPPDQDSAAQFKDEQLGITVKELTYEVRAALRLKPEDPGVVVSKVESGTPAGRARINPFEIVQAADGEPIDSPSKFEAVLTKAHDEKRDQLRLTIVDRGRSRFADLKFTQ